MLNSRRLTSKLLTAAELLQARIEMDAREKLLAAQEKQKFYYDRHAKPLKGSELEDRVRVKENGSWTPLVVTDVWSTPRSYMVKTESGNTLRLIIASLRYFDHLFFSDWITGRPKL